MSAYLCKPKFLFNFSIPFFLTSERFNFRILPAPGDLVSVRYFERIPGRISIFKTFSCYGLCIGQKNSGITSSFMLRNSFKRNSLELRFFLHSPLIARIACYDAKRRRYSKAKLYHLRLKKIAKSRFRFENFKKIL
jgi:ribosomal protein L19